MVPHYRQGHAFVAGDAAHIHSPAGGQGMNTGIQDSYNLGWKLALVANDTAPEALLDTYEAERLPVARHVLEETNANQQLAISHRPMAEFLRNHVLVPLLSSVPPVRERLVEFALRRGSELDVNYRHLELSEQHEHFGSGPAAGDRAPDGQLLDGSGAPTSLFTGFRVPQCRLLLFEGTKPGQNVKELVQVGLRAKEATGDLVRCWLITASLDASGAVDPLLADLTTLRDPDHETHHTYGASTACLYLVRPDGYVGFRSRVASGSKLLDYLRLHFIRES
jgi:hypothetical protein